MREVLNRDLLKFAPLSIFQSWLSRIYAWRYITEIEPAWIEVNEIRVPIQGLDPVFSGFRLAQVSDIHMGGWMNLERLQSAVHLALLQKPDAVALTGDYLPGYGWKDVARRKAQLNDLEIGLRPLAAACPTVSILGNHDHKTNPGAVRAMLARIGATDLSNAVYAVIRGPARFYLAGVDDFNTRHDRLDLVMKKLPGDSPAILLAHEPDFADISAKTGRFALQISGHTHGGQIRLPWIGAPVLPPNGWKYPSGKYQVGSMIQYTNRGIGMGSKNVRFHCRPEITVYRLEPA